MSFRFILFTASCYILIILSFNSHAVANPSAFPLNQCKSAEEIVTYARKDNDPESWERALIALHFCWVDENTDESRAEIVDRIDHIEAVANFQGSHRIPNIQQFGNVCAKAEQAMTRKDYDEAVSNMETCIIFSSGTMADDLKLKARLDFMKRQQRISNETVAYVQKKNLPKISDLSEAPEDSYCSTVLSLQGKAGREKDIAEVLKACFAEDIMKPELTKSLRIYSLRINTFIQNADDLHADADWVLENTIDPTEKRFANVSKGFAFMMQQKNIEAIPYLEKIWGPSIDQSIDFQARELHMKQLLPGKDYEKLIDIIKADRRYFVLSNWHLEALAYLYTQSGDTVNATKYQMAVSNIQAGLAPFGIAPVSKVEQCIALGEKIRGLYNERWVIQSNSTRRDLKNEEVKKEVFARDQQLIAEIDPLETQLSIDCLSYTVKMTDYTKYCESEEMKEILSPTPNYFCKNVLKKEEKS